MKKPTPPKGRKLKEGQEPKKPNCEHINTEITRKYDGEPGFYCYDCGSITNIPLIVKPPINPRDYLRTVTEGDKKPDRDFIWTKDAQVASIERDIQNRKKVYCCNCENDWHHRYCKAVTGIEDTPYDQYEIHAESDIENKNNNCKYYVDKNEKDEIDYDYKFFGLIKCKRK